MHLSIPAEGVPHNAPYSLLLVSCSQTVIYKGDTSTHAHGTHPRVALRAKGELPQINLGARRGSRRRDPMAALRAGPCVLCMLLFIPAQRPIRSQRSPASCSQQNMYVSIHTCATPHSFTDVTGQPVMILYSLLLVSCSQQNMYVSVHTCATPHSFTEVTG